MRKNKNKVDRTFYHTENIDFIFNILRAKSTTIISYLEDHKESSKFTLWYKDIKHADLVSCGKSHPNKYRIVKGEKVLKKKVDPEYEKNVLNYLTVDEMKKIVKKTDKAFPTAHQSNIHVTDAFLQQIGVESIKSGIPSTTEFYLVNDSLTYFTDTYTMKVAEELKKNTANCKGKRISLSEDEFTNIHISLAKHGIGTSKDGLFHEIRHNIFMNDRIYFLVENTKESKIKVYILLDKNPLFYKIIGEKNSAWIKYLATINSQTDNLLKATRPLGAAESRSLQAEWKDNLAREIMAQTEYENQVVCPFTHITADYSKVATLFRASHIVTYHDSNLNQKYDLNNGLLLIANADALFDKHLISVNDEGKLEYSFLIKRNGYLKSALHLDNGIFKAVLTEERKKYLAEHYKIFKRKEQARQNGTIDDVDD